MKKRIFVSIAGITIIIGLTTTAVYLNQNNYLLAQQSEVQSAPEAPAPPQITAEFTYKGIEGRTAFSLLQEKAIIEFTGANGMQMPTIINGMKPDVFKNEYWSLSVNGLPATVSYGSYTTHDTDTVTWKIEKRY